MATRRVTFLDSMRGFAAAWVVLFHLNEVGRFPPSLYQSFVKVGWLGVPVFFVLSGYVIHAAVLRRPTPGTFLWHRFWRIYPPYLASLIVVMAAVLARKLVTGSNDLIAVPHSALGWLEVLTLTTKPVTSTPNINWVYWTLSYEIAFYLWLTLALILPRIRWPVLWAPVLMSLLWHAAPVFFVDQWCLFALGAAIAEWRHRHSPLVIVLMALCLLDAALHRTHGELIVGAVSMALVALSLSERGAWLSREPVLHKAGKWSYSLYLTHVPIGVWIALMIDPWPRALSASSMPLHLAIDAWGLLVSCAFAYLFARLVEGPSIRIAHMPGWNPWRRAAAGNPL